MFRRMSVTRTNDTRLRVLLLEDELLIAMHHEDLLNDLGCEVVGPASTAEQALRHLEREGTRLHAALLDVNLHGRCDDTVAAALETRGVPFAFVTAYAEAAPLARFRGAPVLQKPIRTSELRAVLRVLTGVELDAQPAAPVRREAPERSPTQSSSRRASSQSSGAPPPA
jgi:CheY-like chemotaxis protein